MVGHALKTAAHKIESSHHLGNTASKAITSEMPSMEISVDTATAAVTVSSSLR